MKQNPNVVQGTVLIVDDNVDLAENLQEVLEDEGLEVRIAASAGEALEIVPDFQPALILTDARMPGMSGVELLREVRRRWPAIPVVLITAYSQDRLIDEAREGGVVAILPKPVDLETLRGLVMRTLARVATVLIVEDSGPLRANLMESIQELDGVLPYSAASVKEALRLVEEVDFAAAVIDIRLPDGDGISLATELRTRQPEGPLPVLYVTGFLPDMGESARRTVEDARTRLLEKPISMETFLDTLRGLL